MNKKMYVGIIFFTVMVLFYSLAHVGGFPGIAKPMEIETELPRKANYKDFVTGMELIFVKGGFYEMGDNYGDGLNNEKPVHTVYVDDFYIGKYEVTQGQWEKVMRNNPSNFKKGANYPVEQVSWDDVQHFITKLNRMTGKNYRLPTEAEWEYAARSGGKREKWAGTSDESQIYQYANFCDVNCTHKWKDSRQNDGYKNTSPVGSFKPNGLGIYDMTGNVWELCSDWYSESYYSKSPTENPKGPDSGTYKVQRGGSWYSIPRGLRASGRFCNYLSLRFHLVGFRLVRSE